MSCSRWVSFRLLLLKATPKSLERVWNVEVLEQAAVSCSTHSACATKPFPPLSISGDALALFSLSISDQVYPLFASIIVSTAPMVAFHASVRSLMYLSESPMSA